MFEIERNVWRNIEESYTVNLYRGMVKLKLKINVNLLQLLCVSFLWLYMANLSDFVGFALTVTIRYKKETRASPRELVAC